MNIIDGRSTLPFFMLHGGAGPMDPSPAGLKKATASLKTIATHALSVWDKDDPLKLSALVLAGLEDDEGFNAGFGSALQADGRPRLSAALMDGRSQCFSGVISISDVKNPSRLALELQNKSSRVLTGPGHDLLARTLGLPVADLVSKARLKAWLSKREKAATEADGCDTVGVVVSSQGKALTAGTSTGGRGNEEPGRVSDSATVAGNYASAFAAISVTGIGEQIVDAGVAVRIETRVRDGLSLKAACQRTFDEALAAKHEFGWIACDAGGNWVVAHTSPAMTYLVQCLSGEILASS